MRSAVLLVAALVTVGSVAFGLPQPGARFPELRAEDVTGQTHVTDELAGHRTLVVAITDPGAADSMRAWYRASVTLMPSDVARKSLISLHLPFFVSTGFMRGKARAEVPEPYWHDTLLDRGEMAKQLELRAGDKIPYVFALDADGRVLAAVHTTVDSQDAAQIWRAFQL